MAPKPTYSNKPPIWERARGQWDEIYASLAPELATAMKKPGRHVECPVHQGKNGDAFRLFPDFAMEGAGVCNTCGKFGSGIKLLAWLKDWTNAEAAAEVEAMLDGHAARPAQPSRQVITPPKNDDEFRIRTIVETWEGTVGLGHPLAEPARIYLDRRGLTPMEGPLDDVRFHPGLGYWHDGKRIGTFPAIVSLVRQSDGEVATLHRIYLTEEGSKAPVREVKKMMSYPSFCSLTGAAVRLDLAQGPILHIAEGIETALAVRNVTMEPTWAAISSSIMTSLRPPAHVRTVCIWADRDPTTTRGAIPGLDAANHTAKALREMGVAAVIMMPPPIKHPSETVDWNDVVDRYGAEAIRTWPAYRKMRDALQMRVRSRWRGRATGD